MAIIHATQVCCVCYPDCACFPIGTNEWNANHTIQNCTITNAMLAGCIAACKLACCFIADVTCTALLDGRFWIGNGANVAKELAISGDIGITNGGVASISCGVIINADVNACAAIANSKLTLTSIPDCKITISDPAVASKRIRFDAGSVSACQTRVLTMPDANVNLGALTACNLAACSVGSSEIAANAVGSSELANCAVDTGAIQNLAVTNAKLAGCIADCKLACCYITSIAINGVSDITIACPADNEVIAFNCATCTWINQTAAEAGLAVACHTHCEACISDLGCYIENINCEILNDLGDVSVSCPATGDIIYRNACCAWTRLPKGCDCQVLTQACCIPSWACPSGGGGGPTIKVKASDQSIMCDATLTLDCCLQFCAEANSKYLVTFGIYTVGGACPDLSYGFVLPTGATGKYLNGGDIWRAGSTASITSCAVCGTSTFTQSGNEEIGYQMLLIDTSCCAGVMGYRWSQANSSGCSTTLKANSWMTFQKVT